MPSRQRSSLTSMVESSSRLRSQVLLALFAVALASTACGLFRRDNPTPDRQRDISLHAINQNFYDATFYAIGRGGTRDRLGIVGGNTEEIFRFRWSLLELRIEIDLLSVGSTYTDELPIDEGDELELIITPDLHLRIPE